MHGPVRVEQVCVDAQEGVLDRRRVGDDPAEQYGGRAGDADQRRAEGAAGEGLRDTEGPPSRIERGQGDGGCAHDARRAPRTCAMM
ncbi:hypothetical protein GCM10009651_07070 [Microbacterium natoriense]